MPLDVFWRPFGGILRPCGRLLGLFVASCSLLGPLGIISGLLGRLGAAFGKEKVWRVEVLSKRHVFWSPLGTAGESFGASAQVLRIFFIFWGAFWHSRGHIGDPAWCLCVYV